MSVKSIQRFLRTEIKLVGEDAEARMLLFNGSLLQCNCNIPFRTHLFLFICIFFFVFLNNPSPLFLVDLVPLWREVVQIKIKVFLRSIKKCKTLHFILLGICFLFGLYFIVSYCIFTRHICPTFMLCVYLRFRQGLCYSFVVMQISSVHIR